MRPSSWFFGGMIAAGVAGIVYFGMGLFQPGRFELIQNSGGDSKPLLLEAKRKAEGVRQAREKVGGTSRGFSGLSGKEGEHRVFVSAQLVYLPGNAEPVQPLDPKMVTKDGMEVGWKKEFRFDPADPGVKDADPDGDGFTNLEEFLAKTDPTNKAQSPAKESKLRSRSGEAVPMSVSFSEKSGGLFTIRFQVGPRRGEFKGKPGDSFWIMAGSEGIRSFSDLSKAKDAQTKAKAAGHGAHMIPLEIVSYVENIEKVKDAKAGGVEVEVDNSFLVLERKDALEGPSKLLFSSASSPQSATWDVGEIRLHTPAGGGMELGPFRLGETFSYEGKDFAVIGREGRRIQLRNLSEPKSEPFTVPVETPSPAPVTP